MTAHASAFSLPTTVDGVRYRSRLEARWALFFRALDLSFRYESTPVKLPSGVYLPDFYFPSLSIYAEVKPVPHSRPMLARLAELAHGTGKPVLLLVSIPELRAYDVMEPSGRVAYGAFRFPGAPNLLATAAASARYARFA